MTTAQTIVSFFFVVLLVFSFIYLENRFLKQLWKNFLEWLDKSTVNIQVAFLLICMWVMSKFNKDKNKNYWE